MSNVEPTLNTLMCFHFFIYLISASLKRSHKSFIPTFILKIQNVKRNEHAVIVIVHRGPQCILCWHLSCTMRTSGRNLTPSIRPTSWTKRESSSSETPSCLSLQVGEHLPFPFHVHLFADDILHLAVPLYRSQGLSRRESGQDGALHLPRHPPAALPFHSSSRSFRGRPGSDASSGINPQPLPPWAVCCCLYVRRRWRAWTWKIWCS